MLVRHSTRAPGDCLLAIVLLAVFIVIVAPDPCLAQTSSLPAFLVAQDVELADTQTAASVPVKGQALWRSIFLPGWGHMYKGEIKRGLFFMGGVIGMVGMAQFSDSSRSSAVDNYNVARTNYDAAISQTEIDTYYAEMESEWDSISLYKNLRNFGIIAAVGVYVWNVIDAVRGFPMSESGVDLGMTRTVDGAPAVALTIRR